MKKTRLVQMLENAIDKDGVSEASFAEKHNFSQQTFNTWMNGRVPTRQFHTRLANVLNISDEMLDELIEEAETKREVKKGAQLNWNVRGRRPDAFPPPALEEDMAPNGTFMPGAPAMSMESPVPVYGQAVGGESGEYLFNGDILDWVGRPPSLAGVRNAYAVFVDGESMVPAYKASQTVWVHPTRPVRAGDDVVVQVHGVDEHSVLRGFIKEFVGWTPTKLVLKQHNPPRKIEFDRESVKTVDVIVFAERS